MKAQELRLGNLVIEPVLGIVTIEGIFSNAVYCRKGNDAFLYTIGLDVLQPIPLTEEWLLKFGMNKTFNKILEQKNLFDTPLEVKFEFNGSDDISIWTNYITDVEEDEDEMMSTNLNITNVCKYVHQLQNLYFALTSTELTLKQ